MQVYIIHGYNATPTDHWFEWTKKMLNEKDINVTILELPNPTNPDLKKWLETLEKDIKNIDENTYFITHSLGSITFLKYIQDKNKIGGYILVSGFNGSLPVLKELDSFIDDKLDYESLKNITKNRVVISANDDYIVPVAMSESLANNLHANFVCVKKGGHFLASDGFEEFPLLLEEFHKFI